MDNRHVLADSAVGAPSAPSPGSSGYFTNGNPATATPATKPGAYWFHQIGEELRYLLTQASITPDELDLTQVWQAIQTLALTVIDSNVIYTVGSSGADFTTLQAAHDSLDKKILMPGVTVTFDLQTETHSYASNVIFDHPQARQFYIDAVDGLIGSPPAESGMTYSSSPPTLYGANRASDNSTNATYLAGLYNAKIQFTASAGLVFKTGLGGFSNVLVQGYGTSATAITVQDEGVVEMTAISITGADQGLSIDNAKVRADDLFISGAKSPCILANGATLTLTGNECVIQGATVGFGVTANFASRLVSEISSNFRVRGNIGEGIGLGWNSNVYAPGINLNGNTLNGIWVVGGSSAYVNGGAMNHNGQSGCHASTGSMIDCSSANITSNNYSAGGYSDLEAYEGAHIYAASTAATPTASPPLNTVGNANSYITR